MLEQGDYVLIAALAAFGFERFAKREPRRRGGGGGNAVAQMIDAGIDAFLGLLNRPPAAEDAAQAAMPQMLVEVASPLGFEETLERLEANAKDLGWKVPGKWKVDFQKNLMKVTDTDIGPNRVLKMCEPFAAAKLLLKDEYKMLTAMMPCTIAVYEKSDGKTYIAMMNLGIVGKAIGGDVVVAMQKAMPDMLKMVDFDNPPAMPAAPPAEPDSSASGGN